MKKLLLIALAAAGAVVVFGVIPISALLFSDEEECRDVIRIENLSPAPIQPAILRRTVFVLEV